MIRTCAPLAALALIATGSVDAGVVCPISDWPLDMPEGPSDFVRVLEPRLSANVVTHVHTSTRTVTVGGSRAASAGTPAPVERRDWKDHRVPSPSERQRLSYAVLDDDAARLAGLLEATHLDLNASGSDGRENLVNLAAAMGEPEVLRVLMAHGAHVRNQAGDSAALHPVAEAVEGLQGYLNSRDLPEPFFNRPPRSTERYRAVIRMLLEAGADPDARVLPSDDLSALGNLMFTPRFADDVDLVQLLVAHGASADGPPPLRSALGIALDKGYDDYAAVLLADRHVSSATLNQGLADAVAHGSGTMVQALLEAGADADLASGRTPLLCNTLYSDERRPMALALLAHRAKCQCGLRRQERARADTPDAG